MFTLFVFVFSLITPVDAAKKTESVLWDYWYTVTLEDKTPFAYYNEKVEVLGEQIHFQTKMWKKEEGFINSESLGAFSKNEEGLTPLFYNFYSTYKGTETKMDGTFEGSVLKVKIRSGEKDLPLIQRSIPKKVILSTFFPVWVGKKLNSLKLSSPVSFLAILEDKPESEFKVVTGMVRLEREDGVAKSTQTRRLSVSFQDKPSTWWVDAKGAAVRIDMPGQHAQVNRVTKEKAESFLK